MDFRKPFFLISLILLTVFLLVVVWEFAVEDLIEESFAIPSETSLFAHRWEEVILVVFFAGTSLIVLTLLLRQRKQAEETLRESDARLRAVFDNTPVCLNLKDTEGRYILVNKPYEEWLGRPAEEIIGKKASEFLEQKEEVKTLTRAEKQVLETGEVVEREVSVPRPDGNVYKRILIKFPVKSADGSIAAIGTVAVDITERKRMEEALVESEERHRHFSADVAHELRTPLAVLRSQLDNLENTETNQSLIKDVDAMSRLVSQLLATTRLDSLTVNPNDEANLHAIGIEVAKNLAPFAIKEGRSIEVNGTQNPVMVRGNDDALKMAVRNLVENALRYSAQNTVVTINVSDEPAISVINHGLSIQPEQKKEIFQRFKRADRRSDGAGLGLSIVQRVVEAHQATIDVSDVFGGGTVFKISFPSPKSLKVVTS